MNKKLKNTSIANKTIQNKRHKTKNVESLLSCQLLLDIGPALECGWHSVWPSIGENWFPLFPHVSVANGFLVRGGVSCSRLFLSGGILSRLNLCRSDASFHNLCEFICALVPLCLRDTLFLECVTSCWINSWRIPTGQHFLPWAAIALARYFLYSCWPTVGLRSWGHWQTPKTGSWRTPTWQFLFLLTCTNTQESQAGALTYTELEYESYRDSFK